ncbi:MAG TPA: efflux RND transporter periplasmic adaptor subunit [Vicinamibacteria bacterium]|nr:efflux RND transporter periplasmic adaptor subunit [Vicinamibacteria bacterium]
MTSRSKKILAGALAVVALGAVVGVSVARDARSKVAVQVHKAGRRDLVSVVSASGEVKPKRYVNVAANVSGRIDRLLVQEGERVRTGQLLARIDSTRFAADEKQSQAAVQSARSDLERARADLEVSRLAYERTRRMHDEELVSDQQFDQANAEFEMKKANVDSLRSRIAQLEAARESSADNLQKTAVISPMDGVVTSLAKEEGEVVIGAQSFQPTVIMTVGDLSVMEAEVLVDETDIRNVALGQEAKVRVDALDRLEIAGEVTEIGSSAIPRSATSTGTTASTSANTGNQAKDFKVTVTLKDPPPTLRPGLNATADIVTARKPGVLAVPIQAVVVRQVDKSGKVVDPASFGQEQGEAGSGDALPSKRDVTEREGVFVVATGEAVFRTVKTGILGDTDLEVVEGLKEGEEIVTGSYKTLRTLKDKAKVKLEKEKRS